jgi:GH15 family glucan-1,4-alpha-glucosidase
LLVEALEVIEGNAVPAGILAASKGPIEKGHAEYLHVWPRDAVLSALELMNYRPNEAYRTLEAVCRLPTNPNGLLYQRYEADGTPDNLAWTNGDGAHQIDQDALKLVGASKLPANRLTCPLLEKLHQDYLALVSYAYGGKTSTDVWEQKKGYFFYTSAALLWGLACSRKLFGEKKLSPNHGRLEARLRSSITQFYNPAMGCFVKSPSESVMDLEVALGLCVLFEAKAFAGNKTFLTRAVNSLAFFETELLRPVGDGFAPIRYHGDFWDGEIVGTAGIGRPWPMGTAMLASAYGYCAAEAKSQGDDQTAKYCSVQGKQWFYALQKLPYASTFAEQITVDGRLPPMGPHKLSWAAAEYLRARRILWPNTASKA